MKEFNPEFGAYLEANYFRRSDAVKGKLVYTRHPYKLVIENDEVVFFLHHDAEEDQRQSTFSPFASWNGISQLDTFGWMLLMHLAGVIKLKEFIKELKKDPDLADIWQQIRQTVITEEQNTPLVKDYMRSNFPGIKNPVP